MALRFYARGETFRQLAEVLRAADRRRRRADKRGLKGRSVLNADPA